MDPFVGARFRVEIEGLSASSAAAVVLPEARLFRRTDVESVQYGALIVQRGLTDNTEWYVWWDSAPRSGNSSAKIVVVVLMDAGGKPAWRWTFAGAEPVAYRLSDLNATSAETLIETLELSVASFDAVCVV
ncbi:MAG: phage tail protein [Burkholderiaceae bacterium]|nr:phage tail protein [Burkholderiaceae bacterium]